jgi:tetratricopeptide (TPR) repeat protein
MRSVTHATAAVLLMLLCAVGVTRPAAAQTPFDAAVGLYAAAAYEEALEALDKLTSAEAAPADRAAVDHMRMLCLLALGRTADAEQAIVSLLDQQPTYRLNEDDAAPRVLRLFNEVRQRALPDVVRRRYREAKRLYDAKQHEQADTAFAVVRDLLAEPVLAKSEDPALVDLTHLAAGFADLNRAALDAEERRAVAARAAEMARAAEAARALEVAANSPTDAAVPRSAPPPDLASHIFEAGDADVAPPIIERQDISRWVSNLPRPRAGTNLGSIEVVIDESGAVTAATIRASVSRFYDTMLLESSKLWRYKPATRQGRPVKYRRVIAIVTGG